GSFGGCQTGAELRDRLPRASFRQPFDPSRTFRDGSAIHHQCRASPSVIAAATAASTILFATFSHLTFYVLRFTFHASRSCRLQNQRDGTVNPFPKRSLFVQLFAAGARE